MVEKLGKIKASVFIEWYLDDDTKNDLKDDVAYNIKRNGYFNTTVRSLFDACGYIPTDKCFDVDETLDEDYEFSPEELAFIDDITERKQCNKCHHEYMGDLDYCPNCGNCVS